MWQGCAGQASAVPAVGSMWYSVPLQDVQSATITLSVSSTARHLLAM